ncbi:MAG: YggT family protein [bacterium]|nr:YggT family protein [bacterium]
MEETTQEVQKDRVYADGTQVRETTVATDSSDDGPVTAQRVIRLIIGVVLALHAIRFLLSLFGANRSNAFADIIYTITSPFVAPFRGLFSVDTRVGEVARFEIETIVAAIVYGLLGWLLIKIIGLGRHSNAHTTV